MAGPRITEVSLSLCRFVAVPVAIRHFGAGMNRCSFWEVSACRRIAPCTGMYLVNDIQFSRFRLWLFTCVLYRVQRTSNRDWLCYFADTNSASSACRPHSFLHGNVPGEWDEVFKISVMGFSYLHIVPSPKGFQQGLVVLLLLHY